MTLLITRWSCVMTSGAFLLLMANCGGGDESPPPARPSTPTPVSFANAELEAYVKASNPGGGARPTGIDDTGRPGDGFGTRVASDGDTLAVSAPYEASCARGINGDQSNNACPGAGAVYVFRRINGVWTQQAYIKASNADVADFFGSSLALSGDTLAVGAPGESSCARGVNGDQADNACAGSGAVYVFTRSNDVWSQQAYVKASNTGIAQSFFSVALADDTLAIGATGDNSCATGINGNQLDNRCVGVGAVYVFTRTSNVWIQQAYIKPSHVSSPFLAMLFGSPLALDGNTLAVGAIHESSCATGINGDQLNDGCFASGAVYVFVRSNETWAQQAYVKASNTEFSDAFGAGIALDRNTMALGAAGESSCARGINGDQSDNSCINAGAVYVFTRMPTGWSQQAYVKASKTRDTLRAASIALSGDTLSIGASSPSAAYVLTRNNGTWTEQAYISRGYDFGASLAINDDRLIIGAPSESSCAPGIDGDQSDNNCLGAGAAYVYAAR